MLQKCDHFCKAVDRLTEALVEYQQTPNSSVIRDGVIQRFEFTFELARKSLREYMEDQGAVSEAVFSKQVFKAAYAAGIIGNEQIWLSMLRARNITSHVYDDEQAAQVVSEINDQYMTVLSDLASFYRET